MSFPIHPLLRRHMLLQMVFLCAGVISLLVLLFAPTDFVSPSAIAMIAALLCIAATAIAIACIRSIHAKEESILQSLATDADETPDLPASYRNSALQQSIHTLKVNIQQNKKTDVLMLKALREIGNCSTLNDMLQVIAERAKELTGAKYTALATFNEDSSIDQFITLGMTQAQERGISHMPEGKGLLGYIHKVQQPIMTANLNKHPQAVGFPAGHPPMTSLLAVPILAGTTSLGNLYVTDKIGVGEFTESDKQALLLLAQISAILLSRKAGETAMSNLVEQVTGSVALAAQTTERISTSVEEMLAAMREQTNQTAGVAAATEEMSTTISENLHTTTGVVEMVQHAEENARKSGQVITQTVNSITHIADVISETGNAVSELSVGSSQIGDIVTIISDIADQTNLLALNAAIEAARAGTAGRGFAVVADEVKKLSDKTAHEIRTIKDAVALIQKQTQKSHSAMQRATSEVNAVQQLASAANKALEEIISGLKRVTDGIVSVAATSEQQARASNDIAGTIERLNTVAEQTTEQLESIARSVDELNTELNGWNA